MEGKKIGFFAYGSGSKAKVLEGEVQDGWNNSIDHIALFDELSTRQAISFEEYENWHKGKLATPLVQERDIRLKEVGTEGVTLGYRYYA